MTGIARKALQAVAIWVPVLYLAQLWMVAIVSVVVNMLQPSCSVHGSP